MKLTLRSRALVLLVGSYFTVVPGMTGLLAIGFMTLLAGLLSDGSEAGRPYLAASWFFLVVPPAAFAGSRFRELASRRSHALLPGFCSHMLVSVCTVIVGLAALTAIFSVIVRVGEWASVAALAGLLLSALFWFGFIPFVARVLGAGLVVVVASVVREGGGMARLLEYHPAAVAMLLVLLWTCFGTWFARRLRAGAPFVGAAAVAWSLPLGLATPGGERVGTPAGTMLLGVGDAPSMRIGRAVLGVLGVPILLCCVFWASGQVSVMNLSTNPVFAFLGLTYAFVFFCHLSQRASTRRDLLWLRGDWDRHGLLILVERVLWREVVAIAAALAVLVALVGEVGGVDSSRLAWLPFALAWLSALFVEGYLALITAWPRRARSALMLVHLLALATAAALPHLGYSMTPLWLLTVGQLLLAVTLRGFAFALPHRAEA